jgi:hypothetical protein
MSILVVQTGILDELTAYLWSYPDVRGKLLRTSAKCQPNADISQHFPPFKDSQQMATKCEQFAKGVFPDEFCVLCLLFLALHHFTSLSL